MKKEAAPKENAFVSLLANIVVPALILTKGAKLCARIFGAEPSAALVLVVALAFPTGYFVLDYLRRRELNWISAVGFAGTLLTGGIGLFRLSPFWVAVKEASIPLFIAAVMIFSRKLIRTFLFNETVFDVPAIEEAAAARGNADEIAATLKRCSRVLTASFLLSAALNFALARVIVKTDPELDSAAFNEEIGEMMALSWPIITLPCLIFIFAALLILLKGLEKASGMKAEELFRKK